MWPVWCVIYVPVVVPVTFCTYTLSLMDIIWIFNFDTNPIIWVQSGQIITLNMNLLKPISILQVLSHNPMEGNHWYMTSKKHLLDTNSHSIGLWISVKKTLFKMTIDVYIFPLQIRTVTRWIPPTHVQEWRSWRWALKVPVGVLLQRGAQ